MQKIRNESYSVIKGITLALIFGALCWAILIWGGMFVWKTYIKPTESKVSKVFDIKEESWTHLKFK